MFERRRMDSSAQHRFGRFLLKSIGLCFAGTLLLFSYTAAQTLVLISTEVSFVSEAPLELIKASNKQITGAIDMNNRSFLINVKTTGFKGFNSPLQQDHFMENYLEAEKYPKSVFSGKLIDSFDPKVPGHYEIRVKGMLDIHGVKRERIIKTSIEVRPDLSIYFESGFTVLLDEHNILIPKIVHQKIAEEIRIEVKGKLQ
ncbi:MAG: YceI family protein [Bacteroidia bacterium]